VAGVRDVWRTLEMNYPELHVDTDRQAANMVGVTAQDAAQATLNATLGNINTPSVWIDPRNGQSYYVVTSDDTGAIDDTAALGQVPVSIGKKGQVVELATYGKIRRSMGPISIERNQLERAAHVLMQTEGRDVGTAAAELEQKLKTDPRTKDLAVRFVGQIQLMRETFGGLGLAIARHIIDALGGTIEARSEGRDRGAVFTVRLPRSAASAPEPGS